MTHEGRRWLGLGLVAGALAAAGLALAVSRGSRADPEDVYERALDAIEAGRLDEADASLTRLERLRPPTVLDSGLRARLCIARGEVGPALEALARIPDDHPLAGWARLGAGRLEVRRHRFRAAEAALRRALELDPDSIDARRALIYVLGLQLRRDELHEQFSALAARTTLAPREVWVWCMVRDLVWWSRGEQGPFLRQALSADPDDRQTRLALAENQRRQADYPGAAETLTPLPDSDPDARAARASLALDRGDLDAVATLLADGPDDHPGLASLRGRLALARRDGATAARHFRRVVEARPGRRSALADLGRALQLDGHEDEARPYLDDAARIDALDNLLTQSEDRLARPEATPDPALWLSLADACKTAGRLPEARAWAAVVLARDPLDARARRLRFHSAP